MLWPKPYTIVMNRTAFDSLTDEAAEALAPRRSRGDRSGAPPDRTGRGDGSRPALYEALVRDRDRSAASGLARRGATRLRQARGRPAPRPATRRDGGAGARGGADGPGRPRLPSGHGPRGGRRPGARRHLGDDLEASRTDRRGDRPERCRVAQVGTTPPSLPTVAFGSGRPGSGKSAVGTYSVQGDVIRLVFETGAALQLGDRTSSGGASTGTRSCLGGARERAAAGIPHRPLHARSLDRNR